MLDPRSPLPRGRPFAPTRQASASAPVYVEPLAAAWGSRTHRDPRSPFKPGRPFAPTRTASEPAYDAAADAPAEAGTYWAGLFPQPEFSELSYWGGHFPEGLADEGAGDAGAGTFELTIESGAQITFQWQTDVHKSRTGAERRIAVLDKPRQMYQGPVLLLGEDTRLARSRLAAFAALGSTFLLGLPYECLAIAADATSETENVYSGGILVGTRTYYTITVHSTATCDWALEGQRVVMHNPGTGDAAIGVIESTTSTTFRIKSADPGGAGDRGSRIMPGMSSYLDPQQGFSRYPVNAEQWQVRARAAAFGFGFYGLSGVSDPEVGVGAVVNTFADRPVWDVGIDVDGAAPDSLQSMHDVEDMGGLPFAVGAANVPDWGRSISYTRNSRAAWQWLKRFLDTIQGRFKSFWLPSWRADLVAVSTAFGTLTISAVAGDGDFFTWYPAHRSAIQIQQADGTITYAQINDAVDNGDETITFDIVDTDEDDINLSASPITMVSWLEIVRLESDDVVVSFGEGQHSMQAQARVVQR